MVISDSPSSSPPSSPSWYPGLNVLKRSIGWSDNDDDHEHHSDLKSKRSRIQSSKSSSWTFTRLPLNQVNLSSVHKQLQHAEAQLIQSEKITDQAIDQYKLAKRDEESRKMKRDMLKERQMRMEYELEKQRLEVTVEEIQGRLGKREGIIKVLDARLSSLEKDIIKCHEDNKTLNDEYEKKLEIRAKAMSEKDVMINSANDKIKVLMTDIRKMNDDTEQLKTNHQTAINNLKSIHQQEMNEVYKENSKKISSKDKHIKELDVSIDEYKKIEIELKGYNANLKNFMQEINSRSSELRKHLLPDSVSLTA
ncbi:hypothetical protein I203_107674 [Kwoniella mangroviensis CBS 8507]|uniref:hypothetical protein n=1 Tax=Kwoniella mangroviensis CBS 8507 TaxID=1296122 RepID=UPI00080D5E63|nr:uncharacterized protein I203_02422 [Kwoniella mangroviensis CBS 8507]OCF69026.1 hypothetical protein I203_02422 [Kwoniella mangroviensis CBS 8507]